MMPTRPPIHSPFRAPMKRHVPEDLRPSPSKRGYDRAHERRRLMLLQRNPLCVMCLAEGRPTQATVCDHIVPISQGGSMTDMANLQGLCESCHAKKRQQERRQG